MTDWLVIEKKELLTAIDVLNLVPQRAGVPSSDYIRISQKKKSLEMALASSVSGVVRAKWESGQAEIIDPFYVDRRLFIPFIQAGKSWKGNFKIAVQEEKCLVRHGSRQAAFSMKKDPVGGYSDWQDKNGLKELRLSEDLRKLLLASNQCATADPSMQHLNCVYIGGKLVLATNLAVLFVGVRDKPDEMKFPFPVGIIPLLGEGLVKAVGVEGDRVILDCDCGYIEGTVSAIARKDFPRKDLVEKIQMGRGWPLLVKLPAERLSKMLNRLEEYLASVKREDWLVRMELTEGQLKATVKVQQGKFEESMALDEHKTEGLLEWPLEMVRPVIDYIAEHGETLKVRVDEKKKTPYLLSGGGVEMMVGRRVR